MRLNRFRPGLADDQAVLVAEDPMACRHETAIEFAGERLVEFGASFVADEYRRHGDFSESRKGVVDNFVTRKDVPRKWTSPTLTFPRNFVCHG